MLGGRHSCFVALLAQNALLLFGARSHARGVSNCEKMYGRLGEPAVLSPRGINETLSKAAWHFNTDKIVATDAEINNPKFSKRVSLDRENYSLKIQPLQTADSGNFTFVSFRKGQRPTSCWSLQVQEVLKQPPALNVVNVTKYPNNSCVVLLTCISKSDKNVSYNWKVNGMKRNGSALQHHFGPQEGSTGASFTCTVSNMVSNVSSSKSVNCETRASPPKQGLTGTLIIAGVSSSVLVAIVAVICYRYKKKRAAAVPDELTLYAEIDEATSSKITKPCFIYDSAQSQPTAPNSKPYTVYDQLQLSRLQ